MATVRTKPMGTVAALIAAIALVVGAVPAATRTPGPAREPDPSAFRPLVLRATAAPSVTDLTLTPTPAVSSAVGGVDAATAARLAGVLVDPGGAPVPTRPPTPVLPQARAVVVAKPQPRAVVEPQARAVVRATGWQVAAYSWYGPGLYGNGTACGMTLTRGLLGVAHRSLPCGTRVTFRNPDNGRTVTVRVVDRGPYVSGRLWDLTRGTCAALDACYTGRIQWRLP